jgi:hypothetical protein
LTLLSGPVRRRGLVSAAATRRVHYLEDGRRVH